MLKFSQNLVISHQLKITLVEITLLLQLLWKLFVENSMIGTPKDLNALDSLVDCEMVLSASWFKNHLEPFSFLPRFDTPSIWT